MLNEIIFQRSKNLPENRKKNYELIKISNRIESKLFKRNQFFLLAETAQK